MKKEYYAGDEGLMDVPVKARNGGPSDIYPLTAPNGSSEFGFATSLLDKDNIPWVIKRTNGHFVLYRSWKGLVFRKV